MNTSQSILEEKQAKPSIVILLVKTIQTLLISILSLLLWPFYLLGTRIWKKPPTVPYGSQTKRYLKLAWEADPMTPGLSWQARIWLTLSIIRKFMSTPFFGLAWFIDEMLYGKTLDSLQIVQPIFLISGGRSGSTQMSRYIEEDPTVTAPNLVQSMFPYLWLWHLISKTVGRFMTPEKVRERLASMMPPELLERHEFDPFKSDTFDGALLNGHMNTLAFYLGPEISAQEFNFAKFTDQDASNLNHDAVQLIDRIGRKHFLFSGNGRSNSQSRLFIKGHFLNAAQALENHYPDATFITIIREPASRLQSGINYLRVNPSDPAVGPPPWAWLAASLRQSEAEYCQVEQAWFSQKEGATRCIVRFADFVADLEGTMTAVYKQCFNQDQLPAHVPREHPPRERKNYTVNYSLEELGIDGDALHEELADYVAWCQPQSNKTEAV